MRVHVMCGLCVRAMCGLCVCAVQCMGLVCPCSALAMRVCNVWAMHVRDVMFDVCAVRVCTCVCCVINSISLLLTCNSASRLKCVCTAVSSLKKHAAMLMHSQTDTHTHTRTYMHTHARTHTHTHTHTHTSTHTHRWGQPQNPGSARRQHYFWHAPVLFVLPPIDCRSHTGVQQTCSA